MLRNLVSAFQEGKSAESALRTIKFEALGLAALEASLRGDLARHFEDAVKLIGSLKGKTIVTGVGKSGHIGSKIAATLASTGTPAFFVHSAEANHGDLGMISRDDVILALSWSGETTELKGIISYARRFAIPIVAITSGTHSALAKESKVVIGLPKVHEACPHGLAPTTSTVMQLAIGDALSIALLETRSFTPEHFRTFHPGGQLGASLVRVAGLMHVDDRLPEVRSGANISDAILEISLKGFGCVAVIDANRKLLGIITDGDLRRHMGPDLMAMSVDAVMTHAPKSVRPNSLAGTVIQTMNSSNISAMPVTDDTERLVGIVHLHDLLRLGVV